MHGGRQRPCLGPNYGGTLPQPLLEEYGGVCGGGRFAGWMGPRFVLPDNGHEQVKSAIQVFAEKIEDEKAKDKKVDVTQGPNEKSAIAYLDAMLSLPLTNDAEMQLIIIAKEAIRKGRFQNLQRDINKLKRAVKKSPLKPVIILEKVIGILKSYPLKQEEEEIYQEVQIVKPKVLNPEIIITESFSN